MPAHAVNFVTRRSSRISAIGFAAMVLVFFVHTNNLRVNFRDHSVITGSPAVRFIENALSCGIASAAVPWFFVVSGFLFFYDAPERGTAEMSWFNGKLRRRLQSLVVPYLIWSSFYFGVLTLLKMPAEATHFFKSGDIDFSPTAVLQRVFVDPVPYQLWFVRDLIVYTLLSPLILAVVRRAGLWWLAALALLWVGRTNLVVVSPEGLLFFCAGCWMAINPASIRYLESDRLAGNRRGLLWCGLWIGLALAVGVCGTLWDPLPPLVRELDVLAGLMALWFGFPVWGQPIRPLLLRLAPYTFFLYVAHEPILTIFKKLAFASLEPAPSTHLIAYFGAPAVTAVVLLCVGSLLRDRLPRWYGVLTGWRGVRLEEPQRLQRASIS